ncbi:MAG: hypothetical protein Kilf2KO_36830 [Rhodospirillales bacterium]
MSADGKSGDAPIVIKKYANRRLYNTATSSYVTLDHLSRLIQEGAEFVVCDAKTGDDITRTVLTQIIVEEESKGENLLPISFLRQLIAFYGDNMRWMVPQYLEHIFQNFSENQDRMRGAMQDAMGNIFPFGNLDEVRKQNMAFFEQAMRVWTPFSGNAAEGASQPKPGTASAAPTDRQQPAASTAAKVDEVVRLQAELQSLKAKLAAAAPAQPQQTPAVDSKPIPAAPKPAASPAEGYASKASPPPAANRPAAAEPPPPAATPAATPATPQPKPAAAKPAKRPASGRAPARKAAAKAAPAKAAPAKAATAKPRRSAAPKPRAAKPAAPADD